MIRITEEQKPFFFFFRKQIIYQNTLKEYNDKLQNLYLKMEKITK